jgi:hypothetical protein
VAKSRSASRNRRLLAYFAPRQGIVALPYKRTTRRQDCLPSLRYGSATPAASRKMSIKEFLLERAASDDVQKTLAIGYFLETQEGMSSFNKTDLEKGFRAAKETVPANINDKVNMSIKNGHMMDAAEKKNSLKAWNLTSSGEKYLQNGFKKALSKKDN